MWIFRKLIDSWAVWKWWSDACWFKKWSFLISIRSGNYFFCWKFFGNATWAQFSIFPFYCTTTHQIFCWFFNEIILFKITRDMHFTTFYRIKQSPHEHRKQKAKYPFLSISEMFISWISKKLIIMSTLSELTFLILRVLINR